LKDYKIKNKHYQTLKCDYLDDIDTCQALLNSIRFWYKFVLSCIDSDSVVGTTSHTTEWFLLCRSPRSPNTHPVHNTDANETFSPETETSGL